MLLAIASDEAPALAIPTFMFLTITPNMFPYSATCCLERPHDTAFLLAKSVKLLDASPNVLWIFNICDSYFIASSVPCFIKPNNS